MTTDGATAGAILGLGRSKAYELAKSGEFPVTILRIGRHYLVPTSHARAVGGVGGPATAPEHKLPRGKS